MLWNYANGIDEGQVVKEKPKAKGVGNSTTLANNAETEEEAYAVLKELATSVSQRLKKHHFLAAQISTEIKYASFRSVSHQTTILTPTAEVSEIYQCACQLFDELWDGEPIRLLGIRTTKLQDEEEPTQISLFDLGKYQEQEKQEELLVYTEDKNGKKSEYNATGTDQFDKPLNHTGLSDMQEYRLLQVRFPGLSEFFPVAFPLNRYPHPMFSQFQNLS